MIAVLIIFGIVTGIVVLTLGIVALPTFDEWKPREVRKAEARVAVERARLEEDMIRWQRDYITEKRLAGDKPQLPPGPVRGEVVGEAARFTSEAARR